MAAKSKSAKELDLKYLFKFKCLDIISLAVTLGIPWGFAALIAYWISSAVIGLAGKTTFAQIGLAFLGDFSISEAFAYLFGFGGIGYGLREKALRRDTVERLQGRLTNYELRDDPRRSSSRLTVRGTTHPEDMP